MTTAQFVIRCPKHPSNTGLRLREDCEACKIIYRMRKRADNARRKERAL